MLAPYDTAAVSDMAVAGRYTAAVALLENMRKIVRRAVARAVATIFSNGGAPEARALAKELATVELIEAVLAEHGGAAGQGEVAESLRAAARKIRLGAQAAAQQAQQEAASARR